MSMQSLPKPIRLVAFLAAQLLLVALLFEAVLRVASDHFDSLRMLLYQPAAETHYNHLRSLPDLLANSPPGFHPFAVSFGFVLNSRSLRTSEYQTEKPPGIKRVLAFGDSFTYACGGLRHADHWPTLLQDLLAAGTGSGYQVLRLGVPGTGPQFQYRLWQIEGVRLKPDLVVLGFFVGNDFRDHKGADALREPGLATRWSYAYRALHNLCLVLDGVGEGGKELRPTEQGRPELAGCPIPGYRRNLQRPTFSTEHFLELETRRMKLLLNSERALFEELLGRVTTDIVSFHREVILTGARFVVMIIPDEYQVNPELAQELALRAGWHSQEYEIGRPQKRLGEELDARSIEYLDLLPRFQDQGRNQRLYQLQDTHWNPAGNRLAAQMLAAYLLGDKGTGRPPRTPP